MLEQHKNKSMSIQTRSSKHHESVHSNQYSNLHDKVESKQDYNTEFYEESLKSKEYSNYQQSNSQKEFNEVEKIVNVDLRNYVNNSNNLNSKKPNSFSGKELYRKAKAAYLSGNNEENGYLRNFQKKNEKKSPSTSPINTGSQKRFYKQSGKKQIQVQSKNDSQNNQKNIKKSSSNDLKSNEYHESIREIDQTDKDMSMFQQFLDKNFGSKNESQPEHESNQETDYIEMLKQKQNKLNPPIKTMNNNDQSMNRASSKNLQKNQNSMISSHNSFRSSKNNPFQTLLEKNESCQSKPEVFNSKNLPNHINSKNFSKKNNINFQGFIDSIQQEDLQVNSPQNIENDEISYKLMMQRKNLEDLEKKKSLRSNKENQSKGSYSQRNISSNKQLQNYEQEEPRPMNIRIDISNLSNKVASNINQSSRNKMRMI